MIEVTDEMKKDFINIQHGYCLMSVEGGVELTIHDEYLTKAITRIIELHEANKPKPEPVAYKVQTYHGENTWVSYGECEEWAKSLANNYGDGKYQPLYTEPPREPLSNDEIESIVRNISQRDTMFDLVRAFERAHEIGVEK